MPERKLVLTPINPFTPRQGEIIELVANGSSYKEIATKFGICAQTIKEHVAGNDCFPAKSIFGRIEKATGTRPGRRNWVVGLIGDVLLFADQI